MGRLQSRQTGHRGRRSLSMKPTFIMMIGIPGCGKSSWILKNYYRATIISPDAIRKELSGNISDQSLNVQVWVVAKERAVAALKAGKNVIIDATNVSTMYRREFIKNLPECVLCAKIIECDPETAYSRIAADIAKGIDRANVPDEVVYRMYGEFLYTKKVIESEGFTLL
jgi:predicted kinase